MKGLVFKYKMYLLMSTTVVILTVLSWKLFNTKQGVTEYVNNLHFQEMRLS